MTTNPEPNDDEFVPECGCGLWICHDCRPEHPIHGDLEAQARMARLDSLPIPSDAVAARAAANPPPQRQRKRPADALPPAPSVPEETP